VIHGLHYIAQGELGTDQTVNIIAHLVSASLRKPNIRLLAIQILDRAGVPNKNDQQAAFALYSWVKARIRYVRDPIDVDTVQQPDITLQVKAGDCDDHVALFSALAQSIGLPVRYVVGGASRDTFAHIWSEVLVSGNWISADTTISQPFGYVPQLPVKKIYHMKGAPMSLGAAEEVYPVTRKDFSLAVRSAVVGTLTNNWNQGKINKADLDGYLRVFDEGNSPFRGSIVDDTVKQAIVDFRARIISAGMASPKVGLSGLEGLDGFLSSIVKSVGDVVKQVVNVVKPAVGAAYAAFQSSIDTQAQPVIEKGVPVSTLDNKMYMILGIAALAGIVLLSGKKGR